MGFTRDAALRSPNLALLYVQTCLPTREMPDSVVLPALAETYIFKIAIYSNHIVRN